jgi:hypothetical protein
MKAKFNIFNTSLFTLLVPALSSVALMATDVPDLSKVSSRAELNALIASTGDAKLKQAIVDHACAILDAAQRHPHVEAVIRTLDSSPGEYVKANTTPGSLKETAGGELAFFDTLTMVETKVKGGGAHHHRNASEDPYNADFIRSLGYITSLESLYLEARNVEDSWIAPLLKLKNLKSLTIIGFARLGDDSLAQLKGLKTSAPKLKTLELAYFGKATDEGLELLAGLKDLEKFTFRGSPVHGHGFAKFKGWTKLKSINFHSNQLDDEGLGYVCQNFPNLEFIKLWHSKYLTDASAEHFKKLAKLKGIEISCKEATACLFKHIKEIPLEYAAFESGVNSPASQVVANAKSVPTLRRLSVQVDQFTDEDLKALSGVMQIKELSLNCLAITEERIGLLKNFGYLEGLELVERRKNRHYPDETKAKIKAALPGVAVKFVE